MEENYFKQKLTISKDTLNYTKSELKNADIQINNLEIRYKYDLDILEKKIIRLQVIKTDMEKRIEMLKKKIEQGYIYVDTRTGKGYKSKEARHKDQLNKKTKDAKDNFDAMNKAYKLKKKKGQLDKPVVEAPTGEEIETQQARELRLLNEKLAKLEAEKAELAAKEKASKLVKINDTIAVGLDTGKIINDILEEAEDKIIEAVVEAEKDPIIPEQEYSPEEILEEKKAIANEMRKVADSMNGETEELETLLTMHQNWIEEYKALEGGNAVWQGRLTNGFKAWMETKGYKLGD